MTTETNKFTVLVGFGRHRKSIELDEDVFRARSDFFDTTRSDRWASDKTKPVELHDVKAKTFDDYLECVATGSKALTDADDRELTGPRFDHLLGLYLLGQRLQDYGVQNMVVNEILAAGIRPRWVPDVETLQNVYNTTLGVGSKMRLLIVHFYLFPKTIDQVAAIVDVIKQPDCPHEFHEELAVAGTAVDSDNMPKHTPYRNVCLSRLDCKVWDLAKGQAAGDFARFHTNSPAGRYSTYHQHDARYPNTRH